MNSEFDIDCKLSSGFTVLISGEEFEKVLLFGDLADNRDKLLRFLCQAESVILYRQSPG